MKKKPIALLLAVMMLLSLLPTAALAASGDEPTETGYIENIQWLRTNGNEYGYQVFVKSDVYPYVLPFEFDPAVTEYDLVVPSTMGYMDITGMNGVVTFSDESKANDKAYGRLSLVTAEDEETGEETVEVRYAARTTSADFLDIKGVDTAPACLGWTYWAHQPLVSLSTQFIPKVRLEAGILNEGEPATGTFDEAGPVYTFNIWRSAGFSSVKAAYPDGTVALKQTAYSNKIWKSQEDPTNIVIDGVAADTKALDLTFNVNGSVLKFDDGSGSGAYEAAVNVSGTQYTYALDLTKYTEDCYWVNDALVIPFMCDYDQTQGLGLDGYYTLTLNGVDRPVETAYVKSIFMSKDGNVLLDDFTAEQTSYDLGELPASGSGLPYILLSLENEDNYRDMRFAVTLTDGDGTVRSERDVAFRKTSKSGPNEYVNTYLYDTENGAFRLVNQLPTHTLGSGSAHSFADLYTAFDDVPPGNYTLTIEVYEDGQEDEAETYNFTYSIVPYMMGLTVKAGGKTILTDPDLRNPFYRDDSYYERRYIREFSATSQGNTELTLQVIVNDWLRNQYYGDASTEVSLLFNGEIFPAHYERFDRGTTIDAVLDFSGCESSNGVYTVPFSLIYGEGDNLAHSDFVIYVTVGEPFDWGISSFTEGGVYDKGDTVTLSVEVEGERANDVSYQWQWSENAAEALRGRFDEENSSSMRGDIAGATDSSFTVPTVNSGRRFYRCRVTDNLTGAYTHTDVMTVDVNVGELNDAIIIYHPGLYTATNQVDMHHSMTMEYVEGESIQPIWIIAGPADMTPESGHVPAADTHIAWYYNSVPSAEGAQLLEEADFLQGSQSYFSYGAINYFNEIIKGWCSVHNISENLGIGDHYYFCTVTLTDKNDPTNTSCVTSDFLKITVSPRGSLDGFSGNGTENDPYLINGLSDLEKIDEYVMSGNSLAGCVFRLTADITIPADWESIGGTNKRAFGGTIDGAGKTLTYEEGARSLLEYCRDATVKNLNIYGEEIDGAGLLDKATIDYGDDGVYQDTDPDIITVENVTLLSGSRTKGSGLVNGGYTSGINNIFIKNCTIEEGVVVGFDGDQSAIGSFVGTLNGRIENSVSYATVYGVNSVGGLAGKKGQSMGLCEIVNSAFLGTVEASGGRVGGVIGSGYIADSAPNTPPVTVRNCFVSANITGSSAEIRDSANDHDRGSGIGGIVGSDIGMKASCDLAYISDNYFFGTITDTNPDAEKRYERVGGILGELGGYSPFFQTYANNYYLANGNYGGFGYTDRVIENWTPETDSFIAEDASAFTDGTVLAALNASGSSYKNWVEGDYGMPEHDDSVVYARALKVVGGYKDMYYSGDELDMSDAVFVVTYSDGSTESIDASELVFTGFDSSKTGQQYVKAACDHVAVLLGVRVLLAEPEAITVSFALYGDDDHGEDAGTHTLADGNLTEWIAPVEYESDENTTVLDVFERALTEAGFTWVNDGGNYISEITANGVTLGEMTNGTRSGWMYILNGIYSVNGISEQRLSDGDMILFHYTDDYTMESELGESAVKSIAFTCGNIEIEPGQSAELAVSFTPALLSGNVPVIWSAADENVVSVDKYGVITGLEAGETTVTATAGGVSASCTVTVAAAGAPAVELAITSQPSDYTGRIGDEVSFTVEATGEDVSYQWQYSSDGGKTWKSSGLSGNATATLTTTLTEARLIYRFRCVVTDAAGKKAYSNIVRMYKNEDAAALAFTLQPVNYTGSIGDEVSFTAEAEGEGVSYQWQFSSDAGKTWKNSGLPGNATATLTTVLTEARLIYRFRCVATDAAGNRVISNIVRMLK